MKKINTQLCPAVGTASHQHGLEALLCMETLLCPAVGTASHQHGLEACTVYGDHTVCSCRHSKSSAWVRSITVYGRSETMLKKRKGCNEPIRSKLASAKLHLRFSCDPHSYIISVAILINSSTKTVTSGQC